MLPVQVREEQLGNNGKTQFHGQCYCCGEQGHAEAVRLKGSVHRRPPHEYYSSNNRAGPQGFWNLENDPRILCRFLGSLDTEEYPKTRTPLRNDPSSVTFSGEGTSRLQPTRWTTMATTACCARRARPSVGVDGNPTRTPSLGGVIFAAIARQTGAAQPVISEGSGAEREGGPWGGGTATRRTIAEDVTTVGIDLQSKAVPFAGSFRSQAGPNSAPQTPRDTRHKPLQTRSAEGLSEAPATLALCVLRTPATLVSLMPSCTLIHPTSRTLATITCHRIARRSHTRWIRSVPLVPVAGKLSWKGT